MNDGGTKNENGVEKFGVAPPGRDYSKHIHYSDAATMIQGLCCRRKEVKRKEEKS